MEVEGDGGRKFEVVEGFNAVPRGLSEGALSLEECMSICDKHNCTQFSFNELFRVCYYSNLTTWQGLVNEHIFSGCVADRVSRCGETPLPGTLPPRPITWKVPGTPNKTEQSCGYRLLNSSIAPAGRIYHATTDLGLYNHAAMIDFFDGSFLVAWKNSPEHEDQPGQRILYAQSYDGLDWTPTNGSNVLFPNMTSAANPAAMFAGPMVVLNGHRYATASPHQFCLFPYPYLGEGYVLLLRRVSGDVPAKLGPVFWANPTVPAGFEEATRRNGIVTSSAMDEETRRDLAQLDNWNQLPCGNANGSSTLKCEACRNGCDGFLRLPYASDTPSPLPQEKQQHRVGSLGGSSEETHYTVPNSPADVILHRTGDVLAFTYRANASHEWSLPLLSEIPDADSNLNAGRLPNGRVFLASNPCPGRRYPLAISSSADGWAWDSAVGVLSCEQLGNTPFCANGSTPSLAYPQAVAVTSPPDRAGLYVVVSVDKRDMYSVRVPFDVLL